MKKTIAFLTALITLCSLTSCEENKKEDIKSETEVIQQEVVQTEKPTAAVLPFGEYSVEDFTDINVKIAMQESEPPVKVEEYEISGLEIEPKIPVCALPENRRIEYLDPGFNNKSHYIGDLPVHFDGDEYEKEFMELYAPLLDTPVYPEFNNITADDENVYYVAQYDRRCNIASGYIMDSHDFKIYRYNIETKENTCLYSFESGNSKFNITNMDVVDGEVVFSANCREYSNDKEKCTSGVFKLNSEENELEVLYELENNEYIYSFVKDYDNSLNMAVVGKTGIENYVYTEGEWVETAGNNDELDIFDETVKSYKRDKTIFTECSRFTLDTGLRSAELTALTDKRATYIMSDSTTKKLYTYDFEKMERYIIDLTSLSADYTCISSGENLFMYTDTQGIYIIPELGAAFEIYKTKRDFSNSPENKKPQKFNRVSVYNGKIIVVEQTVTDLVSARSNNVEDNIPIEEDYVGKDKNSLNKIYIINQ